MAPKTRTFTLVVALAAAFTAVLAPRAGAADPLAQAQARITAAQTAANNAAAEFDAAQTRYYSLQDDIGRTQRTVETLRIESQHLLAIIRGRAIVAYEGGGPSPLDGLLSDSSDAIEIGRRAVLLNHANATSKNALDQFTATTTDLRARESALREQLAAQSKSLDELKARATQLQDDLATAQREQQQLRAELERQRRLAEYATLLRQAQSAARARTAAQQGAATSPTTGGGGTDDTGGNGGGGNNGGGGEGTILGSGSWVCPVQGGVSFTDTYGAPRSGGRSHKGVDMFAASGTPTVAVLAGSVFFQSDPLGGLAAYVQGRDGNTYYYAHLNDYVGGGRSVKAGELIGHVGNTGDASGGPSHLHFEIRIGGPNGERINPYPTVAAHC